jgi:hypothetical protein
MKWLFPILIAVSAAAVEPPPKKLDGVSQAAIQSAFQILRSEYIRSGDLTFDELNRAALQGLLQRLDLGAELVTREEALKPARLNGVLAEMLTPQIAYLRPISWAENEVGILEKKLTGFREAKVPYLILDLRSPAAPGEFPIAAALLDLFIARGEVLFRLKQVGRDDAQLFIANRDPIWTSSLLVLVDAETNNLGETVAAVLRQTKRAVVIGSKTRGATVRYETQPLDGYWMLRFARAEVLLPDGSSLFRKGLAPDFEVALPALDKRKIFDNSETVHAVKNTIFETARPRYNEAALVARKNPELDLYIRRSTAKPDDASDSLMPKDTVLQRAVDMLTAKQHFQSATMQWPQRPSTAPGKTTIRKATPATDP